MKLSAPILLSLMLVGCSSGSSDGSTGFVDILFSPQVEGVAVECGETKYKLGLSQTEVSLQEFRLYAHDFKWIDNDGKETAIELDQDGEWQRNGVALLDFANDTGDCSTGSTATRNFVRGKMPAEPVAALSFTIGVSEAENHLDSATAPAPFNHPGMWWTWKGGYKYFRLDFKNAAGKTWFFHHGATGCSGSVEEGFQCKHRNLGTMKLAGFDPTQHEIVFDIGKLYADSDLDGEKEQGDFVDGCMAFPGDKQCAPLFLGLGLSFESEEAGPEQKAFSLQNFDGTKAAFNSVRSNTECTETDKKTPSNPCFVRDPALNVENIGREGLEKSHYFGQNCMKCHQANGPGKGLYTVAGSIYKEDKKTPHPGAVVKLYADAARTQEVASFTADKLGNIYTTADVSLPSRPVWVDVLSADGKNKESMISPKISGACNVCHSSGFPAFVKE